MSRRATSEEQEARLEQEAKFKARRESVAREKAQKQKLALKMATIEMALMMPAEDEAYPPKVT